MWISRRRSMPGVFTLFFLLAAILPSLAASRVVAAQRGSRACAPEGGAGVRVVAVEEGFALLLEDGRLVWPAGIDPPATTRDDPQFGEHGRQALAARLVGTLIVGPARGRGAGPLGSDRRPGLRSAAGRSGAGRRRGNDRCGRLRRGSALRRRRAPACPRSCGRKQRRAMPGSASGPIRLMGCSPPMLPTPLRDDLGRCRLSRAVSPALARAGRAPISISDRGAAWTSASSLRGRMARPSTGQACRCMDLLGRRVRVRGLLDKGSGPQIEISDPDWLEMIEGT